MIGQEIVNEILDNVSKEKIKDVLFEGANIVLYTKDRKYFINPGNEIKEEVRKCSSFYWTIPWSGIWIWTSNSGKRHLPIGGWTDCIYELW